MVQGCHNGNVFNEARVRDGHANHRGASSVQVEIISSGIEQIEIRMSSLVKLVNENLLLKSYSRFSRRASQQRSAGLPPAGPMRPPVPDLTEVQISAEIIFV